MEFLYVILTSVYACLYVCMCSSAEEDGSEGVDVELSLCRDEVCSILSPKPALQSHKEAASVLDRYTYYIHTYIIATNPNLHRTWPRVRGRACRQVRVAVRKSNDEW